MLFVTVMMGNDSDASSFISGLRSIHIGCLLAVASLSVSLYSIKRKSYCKIKCSSSIKDELSNQSCSYSETHNRNVPKSEFARESNIMASEHNQKRSLAQDCRMLRNEKESIQCYDDKNSLKIRLSSSEREVARLQCVNATLAQRLARVSAAAGHVEPTGGSMNIDSLVARIRMLRKKSEEMQAVESHEESICQHDSLVSNLLNKIDRNKIRIDKLEDRLNIVEKEKKVNVDYSKEKSNSFETWSTNEAENLLLSDADSKQEDVDSETDLQTQESKTVLPTNDSDQNSDFPLNKVSHLTLDKRIHGSSDSNESLNHEWHRCYDPDTSIYPWFYELTNQQTSWELPNGKLAWCAHINQWVSSMWEGLETKSNDPLKGEWKQLNLPSLEEMARSPKNHHLVARTGIVTPRKIQSPLSFGLSSELY